MLLEVLNCCCFCFCMYFRHTLKVSPSAQTHFCPPKSLNGNLVSDLKHLFQTGLNNLTFQRRFMIISKLERYSEANLLSSTRILCWDVLCRGYRRCFKSKKSLIDVQLIVKVISSHKLKKARERTDLKHGNKTSS